MPLAYGIGGLINVPPGPLKGQGPPPDTFKGQLGQFYFDTSSSPYNVYVYDGLTWQIGANALATTTTPGIVEIDDDLSDVPASDFVVPSAMAAKTYIDNIAIAGAPAWSETVSGIGQIATTAEAIAVTDDTVVMTPLKMARLFEFPPAIGSLIPSTGRFTIISVIGHAEFQESLLVETRGTPLYLANDDHEDPIFLGTGLGEREITIGNSSGVTSVIIESGTGPINIGTNIVAHTVNIGNTTGATEVNLDAGTGGVNVSTNLNMTTAATKISLTGGAATDFIGTGTLVGGVCVISNTNIAATDRIMITRSDLNGSPALGNLIYLINAGINFRVTSSDNSGVIVATDVSSFTYVIFRQS
jgi:hypothetical protein